MSRMSEIQKIAVRSLGHVPVRGRRSIIPLERIHTDCVGPWGIDISILIIGKIIKCTFSALTMICEATLWPEMCILDSIKFGTLHMLPTPIDFVVFPDLQ